MIHYEKPENWIAYDGTRIVNDLATAKAAIISLQTVPYQKRWVDALQKMELKREVAGTSRIEGAEFTTRELDRVMREETPDELFTRSQRQAAAALEAYKWIRTLPTDYPVDEDLIREVHRAIVTGADDDHCEPGKLRESGQNVTFGSPAHRGVEGGDSTTDAFAELSVAINGVFRDHDPLIQAIAAHYHIAAMHPFLDGNGRTARAVEALMMRRAGLRETTFIAMSNYYYDEKPGYLASLAAVRARRHDLTPFLRFALRGVELQARRLLNEIQREIKRELFRTFMHDLFGRLVTPRKRVIADRQKRILNALLATDSLTIPELVDRVSPEYDGLKNGTKALIRDVSGLFELRAMRVFTDSNGERRFAVELDWPSTTTESEFFETIKNMPKAKVIDWLTK